MKLATLSSDNIMKAGDTPGKILDSISPIPSKSKGETCRKRGRQLAEVLTSKENILKRKSLLEKKTEALKQKEERKKTKSLQKNIKAKSRKLRKRELNVSSDSSDSDAENMVLDSDTASENLECECVGCGEIYEQTKSNEDWIECVVCRRWLHEGCTSFTNMCLRCGKRQ